MQFDSFSTTELRPYYLLYCLPVALLTWTVGLVIYRLYLHPLAHVPGPRWAAVTWLYQTYYSAAGGRSRFYQQIAKLHERYGKSFDGVASQPEYKHVPRASSYPGCDKR